jgi:hypothetical protein
MAFGCNTQPITYVVLSYDPSADTRHYIHFGSGSSSTTDHIRQYQARYGDLLAQIAL